MNTNEFDTLMNIVYSRWGAKAYPAAVKERIWYHVKDLPQKSLETIIYTLLDTSRYAPMPQEFKMLSYAEKDRLGVSKSKEPQCKPSGEAKCWDCADSGNLFARHIQKGTSATFRCHCAVGRSRPTAQGEQWTVAWELYYTKEPIFEQGLGNWQPTPEQPLKLLVSELRSLHVEADREKRKRSGELKPVSAMLPGHEPKEPA